MSGYRPEPEDSERLTKRFELNLFSLLLLAPALVGAFLIIDGFANSDYIRLALGLLLLAGAPFIARWAWRGGLWR